MFRLGGKLRFSQLKSIKKSSDKLQSKLFSTIDLKKPVSSVAAAPTIKVKDINVNDVGKAVQIKVSSMKFP